MLGPEIPIQRVFTSMLDLAYEEHGPKEGRVIILLHGFPYDPRCYDTMVPVLAARGYRIIVPYLRGYGPTRFISENIKRSGQQAALGRDLLELMDALSIERAALYGYDWGGRAACIVAALWPERVRCLVSADGYNIQNIAGFATPQAPEIEHTFWYQYYFHTQRGRDGLAVNRRDLARFLWRLWSPTWNFDEETYARTSPSFENPDFVDVVVHSYRHRYGYEPGDPQLEGIEEKLSKQPLIQVPAICLSGADDGVFSASELIDDACYFTSHFEARVLPGVGHNIPQEAPTASTEALLELCELTAKT